MTSEQSQEHRPIRVVLADDDPFVVTSLSVILGAESDIEVVATASDGNEAHALYQRHNPDILLLDIQMPGAGGLDAAADILKSHPQARIVLLTTFADDEYIIAALRLGVKGYLIKQEVSTVAAALRSVMEGQNVLGSKVVGKMSALMEQGERDAPPQPSHPNAPAARSVGDGGAGDPPSRPERDTRLAQLTDREQDIVALVAQGLDNREISQRLYLSEGTVRNHISTVLQKLSLKNRTQLAVWFYR